jgi:decaprenylphospho-beta-D-ribofuranose 2-oxidase
MRAADIILSGWSRTIWSRCTAYRPERMPEAIARIGTPATHTGIVIHGAGRSYGDCALNSGGAALLTGRLDRILAFEPESGLLQVEPGVTFRRLLEVFLPRGFLAPVTPGTGFATVGGAVANDVHGKNHEKSGSFAQHVCELDLVTPDGECRTITPESDVFRATAGGMGLTGLITRIAFRMIRVPGPTLRVRERRAKDLDDFLHAMEDEAGATYSVGWIDGAASGARLGRGILQTAEPEPGGQLVLPRKSFAVPVDFPHFVLSPMSIRLFNTAYYHRVPARGRTRLTGYATFLYPLDAIRQWNRLYGRAGFQQFQCVVPFDRGDAALRALLDVIAASRRASFLAVLKRMGPGRAGFLSFPMAGYTLALDFPQRPGVAELYAQLCRITMDFGGRIYLAKDALLDAEMFRRMYGQFPDFARTRVAIDPAGSLQSDMCRRLRLHDVS